jgi:serine/threonine protein kinase
LAFGDTEILARLSTGGMGEVLLGRRHGALGFEKLCAVKTIRGDLTSRADFRAMFLDEARLVARLDHPSIAQVYDFGEEGSTLYLAMEYVPGVPLSQLLKAGRAPFPPSIAARMIADVLRGLHYAHEVTDVSGQPLGVVHRDVSPQNIILTFEGRMKILDFGIAITKDREAPDTAVGVLKGKPSYMAPEHLRGGAVDRRADVFSASVVLHELLTGQKLFTRETALATALAVESDPITPPSALVDGLSEGLDLVVMRGLARKPEDRYPDARAMADALESYARKLDLLTVEAFAKKELAEEAEAHQAWLIDVLDRAEREGGIPDEEVTGPEPPKLIDSTLPGPPPEPRSSLSPPPVSRSPLPVRVTSAPPDPVRLLAPRTSWTAGADDNATQIPGQTGQRRGWLWPASVVLALLLILYAALSGDDDHHGATVEPLPTQAAVTPTPTPSATPTALPEGDADAPATPAPGTSRTPRPTPTASPSVSPSASAQPSKKPRKDDEPTGPPGTLVIGADPYANVRIDGVDVGVTPLRKQLPPGEHDVELVSPDSGAVRWKKVVVVEAEQTVRIKVP